MLILPPLIEAVTGEELLTGEDLNGYERGMRAVGAVLDAVTLGQAMAATSIMGLGTKEALQMMGKVALVEFGSNVTAYGVVELGEAIDLPVPVTVMLSFAAGITVNKKLGDLVFRNADGLELIRVHSSGDGTGGDNITSFADLMTPEDAEAYLKFLENGSTEGFTAAEIEGIQRVDEFLVLNQINYQDILDLRGLDDGVVGGLDILSKPSSRVLRQNLIAAGVEVPDYPNAAHHIVAGNSPKAAEARAILQRYGIGINDATNGVFLPTSRDVIEGTYHPSLHTNMYYDEINSLLSDATSKQEVLDVLNYISESLRDGSFLNFMEEME